MVKLGDKIRSLRKQAALTQEELAERATLTKGFISQVERDRTSLSVDSLLQILGALDRSPAEFFQDGAETQVVFTRRDRVRVVRLGVSGFELLIPGAQNRRRRPTRAMSSASSCGGRWGFASDGSGGPSGGESVSTLRRTGPTASRTWGGPQRCSSG
jgi:transcriptional regulator with XRE-family HTH domain